MPTPGAMGRPPNNRPDDWVSFATIKRHYWAARMKLFAAAGLPTTANNADLLRAWWAKQQHTLRAVPSGNGHCEHPPLVAQTVKADADPAAPQSHDTDKAGNPGHIQP